VENPGDKLSTIVIRLFELAADTRLAKSKRKHIYRIALRLHAYTMLLAQRQFEKAPPEYRSAMAHVKRTNAALQKAKNAIGAIVNAVKDVSRLVGEVENLLITVAAVVA